MIKKVETFVNEKGFEVRKLTEYNKEDINILPIFQGSAVVMFRSPMGQQVPQQFTFEFPPIIQTLEEAFDKFEIYIKMELDKQQKEFEKKMMEKSKEIVVAGQMPQTMPFPGRKK